jgi:hypothetical protein
MERIGFILRVTIVLKICRYGKKFGDAPNMISEPCFHCRSHAKGLVYPAEIVVREVQSTCRLQIVQLLAESVRQPRKPANRLTHRHILAFDKAGGYVAHIGRPVAYPYYRFYHRSRGIAASSIVLAVVAVQLYHLREVSLAREHVVNTLPVATWQSEIDSSFTAVASSACHSRSETRDRNARTFPARPRLFPFAVAP